MVLKRNSRIRQAARRAGIKIESPGPRLPTAEQEETDIM